MDTVPFVPRLNMGHREMGLLLAGDVLHRSKSGAARPRGPEDVELLSGRFETLLRWVAHGYHLFFVANQSGIAAGEETRENVDATLQRTAELLKLPVTEIAYCPHQARPIACWCHLPMPGLGVYFMDRHRLARRHLVVVGNTASDAEFAAGLGARFFHAEHFFGVRR